MSYPFNVLGEQSTPPNSGQEHQEQESPENLNHLMNVMRDETTRPFSNSPVLGQDAPGLPHHPDRHPLGQFAPRRAEQQIVL